MILPSARTFYLFARSGDQKVRGVIRLSSLLHLQPCQPDEEETPGRTDWNKGRQFLDESYAATCWDDESSDGGNIVSFRMARLVPTNTMHGRKTLLWSTSSSARRLLWVNNVNWNWNGQNATQSPASRLLRGFHWEWPNFISDFFWIIPLSNTPTLCCVG